MSPTAFKILFRLSCSDFTIPFLPCKQPKLWHPLHLTGCCRSYIVVSSKTTHHPPICWHLSGDMSHTREHETHHSVQAGLLKVVRHSAGNTLLAVGRVEWEIWNPALEMQQICLPANVCKYSPFAHQEKPRLNISISDEIFDLLQIDQPKAFRDVLYASTSLDQCVSQARFFNNYNFCHKVYFN